MEIVARKIGPHESFPNVGYIEGLFKVDHKGQIVALEEHELDKKIEVHQYNEVNSYFQKGALFKIIITPDVSDSSKFIANGQNAVRLVDSAAHLIQAELPNRNDKEIILPDDNFPGTKIIFIVDRQGSCYGPLEWEIKDKDNKIIILKKNSTHLETFKLPEEFIHKITVKDIFGFAAYNQYRNIFLVNQLAELGVFLQSLKEYFDYSSDQEIISFFTKKLNKRNTPINEITPQHLANSINKNIYSKELIQHKIDLLKEINDDEDKNIENIYQSIENFFLTDKGRQVIENYAKSNKSDLGKIISFEKDNEFNEQFKEKEAKLKSINDRIEQAREELSQQSSDKNVDQSLILDSTLMQELTDLREKSAASKNLQYMKWEKDRLQEEIDGLKNKKTDATVEFSKISDDIKVLMSDAKSSALEFKLFWDLYSKKEITINPCESLACETSTEKLKINENLLKAQEASIDCLHYKITKDGNYFLSKLMLANLMLATQQNFITFLAGPPGVGKTSLAKKFCEKQSISKRLLNVAVSRGWTSQRDLIGFYNPLNECFQVSNSGVFNFLTSIGQEKVEDNQPNSYILLDEANLSPIEHYWSSFMGQSDYKSKEVNLGNQILPIPDNVRFIGTINYDETTEKLSPRILNRATIINIDNIGYENEIVNISEDLQDIYPLSYKDAESLFGPVLNPSLKTQEEETFKKVINILELKRHDLGRPIIVSHRKKEAIQQYCSKGRNLLEMYTDNPLTALDLAIKQNILPLISGYGYGLQKRLNELLEILDQLNLEHSTAHLRDMIEYGNLEMNSYDFFNI